jgi:hypothetical protein
MRLDKWSEDFLSGIESDANLHGMAIPMRNARILLSSDKFQTAMKEAGRELELRNMITILRRAQGVTTSKGILDVLGGKIQRGFTASALGFRISTVGAQAMSFPAAQAEIGVIMRPMGVIGFKDGISRITEDSALLSMRWKGRRIGTEVGTSASFEAFDILFFGKAKKLSNKALGKMLKGDQFAIWNIYDKGVVPEIFDVKRNGKNVDPFTWEGDNVADLPIMTDENSEAFRYVAARRLEYVVRRTQPMFDMLDRSVALSNPNVWTRSLVPFRTALEAQENIAQRAVDAYVKSGKTVKDKGKLVKDISAVTASAFSVAVWKEGLKWAIATGATAALATFGIFKFDDKKERKNVAEEVGKSTVKNLVRLTLPGKFAVSIAERIAQSVAGEGYNWNRDTFDSPILDILQGGADTVVALAKAISDAGLTDEFVEEITSGDKEFNKQLEDKIFGDWEQAIRSVFDFGVRITGAPFLAPTQELVGPLLADSKIKIIREVTFGDVDSPKAFSTKVFDLFELRTKLKRKSKKKRLTRKEEQTLSVLDRFASKMNSAADIIKETGDPKTRKLRFRSLESAISTTESRVELLKENK